MEIDDGPRTTDDGLLATNGHTKNDAATSSGNRSRWIKKLKKQRLRFSSNGNRAIAEEPWMNGKEHHGLKYGVGEWTGDDGSRAGDRKRRGTYNMLLFAWLYYK